jgi:hypothetical protein
MVVIRNACKVLVITLGRDLFNGEEVAVIWTRLVDFRRFQWQLF